ncbi:MAG: hypothetical protein ABJF89_15925 [Parasphingorhabdus sp.]|uniref:hypothetical protein n=1 Tax=Parasphingorhabdus sp. TaxID=2709688 RepID=UPI003263AA82
MFNRPSSNCPLPIFRKPKAIDLQFPYMEMVSFALKSRGKATKKQFNGLQEAGHRDKGVANKFTSTGASS